MGDKSTEEKAAKKARKAALKEEADKLGISYEELKKQKKSKKREAEQLQDPTHQTEMKRMRTWSKDFDEDDDPSSAKKRRTRSMDEKEKSGKSLSPEAWRNEHSIQIQGHGSNRSAVEFADPFLKFTDTPYCAAIQKMFQQAGYDAPTHIQSQVRVLFVKVHGSSYHCSLTQYSLLFARHGRLPLKDTT
jgi:hypothetical protein